MAFEINVDSYSYASEPKKESGNYAAELAKKLVAEEAEARAYADKALKEQAETCFEEEAEKRRGADAALQEQINTEKVLRESKDMELEAALAAESSERQSSHQELNRSVSELGISLAAEISERSLGDRTLEESIESLNEAKANKASTLAGYGITDAYTKAEADSRFAGMVDQTFDGTSENAQSGMAIKPEFDKLWNDINGFTSSIGTTVGDLIVLKADKTDVYTKTEIDSQMGDIESALDKIIAIQNNLLGVSE